MREHKYIRYFFITLLLVFQVSTGFFAQNIPPRPVPARTVNDLADVLTQSEEIQLEQKLRAYNDSTSSQIVLVTIKSVGQYAMSDVALKILRDWGVGQKDKDNGVVLLAAMEDRKVRIEVGFGLEGALPDMICKRIIDTYVLPNFKSGNYYRGFDQATEKIVEYARGEYKSEPQTGEGDIVPLLLMLLFIIFFLYVFYKVNQRRGGTMVTRRGYNTWDDGPVIITGPRRTWYDNNDNSGGWGGGGGGFDFGGGSGGGGGAEGGW